MNYQRFTMIAVAVITLALWSCTPDKVGPSNAGAGNNEISLQADNGPHPALFPRCSPLDTVPLANINGNLNLNGSNTAWGWLKMYNGANTSGEEILAIDYTIATNWFISDIVTYYGDPANIQVGPNGVPVIDASWTSKVVNPVINRHQDRISLDGRPTKNTLCARLTVGQLDYVAFDGTLDPNTITNLWIWNDQYASTNIDRVSNSPLQMPWTTIWCAPQVQPNDTITQGNCSGCESENTVIFSGDCKDIDVSSCKDLSNVVLVFDDCTWQKFDGLSQPTGSFAGTGANLDKDISHAYIKSGCYKSGEGPGFGLRFDGPCLNTNCQPVSSGGNGGGGNGNGGNGNGGGNGKGKNK